MKSKSTKTSFIKHCVLITAISFQQQAAAQTPQIFPNGIGIGSTPSYLYNYPQGINRFSTILDAENAGIALYSPWSETTRGTWDGGVHFLGTPISMVLGADLEGETGTFDIWRHGDYHSDGAQAIPAFRIDTATNIASFNGLGISVTGGSLTISGSPVMTETGAPAYLAGQGFIQTATLNTALSAYVPRGNVTYGGLLALGTGQARFGSVALSNSSVASGIHSYAAGFAASALGKNSIALGYSSKAHYFDSVAIGAWAEAGDPNVTSYPTIYTAPIAIGYQSKAYGDYSIAVGAQSQSKGKYSGTFHGGKANGQFSFAASYASADGDSSFSLGGWASKAGVVTSPGPNHTLGHCSVAVGGVKNSPSGYASYAFGLFNSPSAAASLSLGSGSIGGGDSTSWVETDPLLELGNTAVDIGNLVEPTVGRSNAITTLKNGQTTLTNKSWKADPNLTPSTDNSNGNALVVDGHTVLNGKVIISVPQGDISMGEYQ